MADKDPSMTEILASIRRIISEDDGDFAAAPSERPAAGSQERPPATDDMDPEAAQTEQAPQPSPPPPAPAANQPPAPPEDAPEPPQPAAENAPPEPDPALLSTRSQDEAGRAFDRLRRNVAVPQGESVALDALVRQLLHPLLRQWLDANLPKLVETLVREEIRRIARKQDE